MKFTKKLKTTLMVVIVILAGLSLMPIFEDPFHQKDELVCFWEWAYRELWELFNGEVPVGGET